jgi:hypothetical protein
MIGLAENKNLLQKNKLQRELTSLFIVKQDMHFFKKLKMKR